MKFFSLVMLSFFISIWVKASENNIIFRLASHDDLEVILILDAVVSYEYFKPLLLLDSEYEGNDRKVEEFLDDELETDVIWFKDCIAMKDQQRLLVLLYQGKCVGFVAFHNQDETILVIDLLMIHSKHRGKGFGRKMIERCIQEFPQVTTCMLIVLDKNMLARAAY